MMKNPMKKTLECVIDPSVGSGCEIETLAEMQFLPGLELYSIETVATSALLTNLFQPLLDLVPIGA